MPPRQFRDLLVAHRTQSALFTPEGGEFPTTSQGVAHLHAEAFLEVEFPGGIVGIGSLQHFGVPSNGRLGELIQTNGARCSVAVWDLPGEYPGVVANGSE